jgi:CelD/BcsL family acetyltransferase involved in cellulose biosynthesis
MVSPLLKKSISPEGVSVKYETVSLSDGVAMKAWDAFVESHPAATPSHLSCWLRAIHSTYSFEPLLYIAKGPEGGIAGVFPLFKIANPLGGAHIVSLPFSDYGGPLCMDPAVETDMVKSVRSKYDRKVKYFEIRGMLKEPDGFLPYNYYKKHVLDLHQGIDAIQRKVDKKTILYSVRKAEKAGVSIRQENTRAGLDEFYRLNNLTRRKHGVPSQPRSFFNNLFSCMISEDRGFILTAVHDSQVIAASIFLTVGKNIHYKYSASDPALLKKFSPNHLLTWHAIQWGVAQGYASLDFGRTSPDNEGLIRYKNMWGMKDKELLYYYYPRIKGAVSKKESGFGYRLMTSMWRHVPLGIMEMMSPVIYKHLG